MFRGKYQEMTSLAAMKTQSIFSILVAVGLAASGPALATTASSDPVGFVTVTVKANSDANIAVPLNRTAEFKGAVASVNTGTSEITVSGTPGWTANQFSPLTTANKTYAVQFATGSKEGMTGKITNNTTNSITVQLDSGDDLTGIVAGDQIDVMPYWTPGTLFSTTPPVGMVISGFENAGAGVNLGSSELYTHAGSNAWEDDINGGPATHNILRFGASLVVRNPSGADFSLSLVGAVPMSQQRIRISTLVGNTDQDVSIGYMSPIPESLSSIGDPNVPVQNQSANALQFPAQVGDSIAGFDNSQTGINKGASEIYTWNGSAWEDDINGGVINYTVKLNPGFGYIFRKKGTPNPTSVVWVHLQGYLQ